MRSFLYREPLKQEISKLGFSYTKKVQPLPTAFSHADALAVIQHIEGAARLAASLMYGSRLSTQGNGADPELDLLRSSYHKS